MRTSVLFWLLIALLSSSLAACGGANRNHNTPAARMTPGADGASDDLAAEPAGATDGDGDDSLGMPNEHHLPSGLITAGTPDRASLEAARDRGVTIVISLRAMDEPGAADEQAIVEELGMTFVSIPVAGAGGVTEDNARAVDEAIGDSESTTVLHCSGANRAGAMVALRAFFVQGATKSGALALGRDAGLTRLEDAVVSVIDAHCAEHPDPTRCN